MSNSAIYNKSLLQYKNQFVRDLAWIFASSTLIEASQFSFEQKPLSSLWLEKLDSNPELLNTHLKSKNLKMLGPYFEALWQFYLENYPGKKLITKNKQVFCDNKTIGEFDFIYEDLTSGEIRHLEVAVKYYLGIPDEKNENTKFSLMKNWIGPGVNDSLDKKTDKLTKHQSQLANTSSGKEVLRRLGFDTVCSEVCIMGYLFYPMTKKMYPAKLTNSKHNRGFWIRREQVSKLLQRKKLWYVMQKPHWLAPISKQSTELFSFDELLMTIEKYFAECSFPLLISSFIASDKLNKDKLYNDELIFVVPDDWPTIKTSNKLSSQN